MHLLSLAVPNLMSDMAIEIKEKVWREIITELQEKVPVLKDLGITA